MRLIEKISHTYMYGLEVPFAMSHSALANAPIVRTDFNPRSYGQLSRYAGLHRVLNRALGSIRNSMEADYGNGLHLGKKNP
jgi:hypothetical protein